MKSIYSFLATGSLLLVLAFASCIPKPDTLVDDGGGRKKSDFPELAIDVFQPMDGGVKLTPEGIKGRNTWNLWCGGNEQFWDRMAREGFGLFDLLKTIDSRQHDERFQLKGLINQPGFKKASKPDQYGLWIDEPVNPVQPEPAGIDPKVYGRPSGIMGFRLFDNPDFVGEAVKRWDGKRYNDDPDYAVQPGLVRPYRVGVSCGSCHIAFHPDHPPEDVRNPQWSELASAIGNQYIREGAVFAPNVRPGGFFWEMLKKQPVGTSDTSRIATDNLNNPNAINAIFDLNARIKTQHEEKLAGGSLRLPGAHETMPVAHILKDGADSVGIPGATIRVYVNIGMYSQHWLQQHNALVGLVKQKPFDILTAQDKSVYWVATQDKVTNIAEFFKQLKPYRLEDAPGGKDFMTSDEAVLAKGRAAFAANCAECHTSKPVPTTFDAQTWAAFREDNFFSDEERYSVAELQTNANRAAGTNATRGHIWSNFSSETYKSLAPAEPIKVWNPYTGAEQDFQIPGGGPGYYRTPSLISIWSSAPFLHNNALGEANGDPSVQGRMAVFQDSVEKLLWKEKRLDKNSIWRTTRECSLQLQAAVLPEPLRTLLKPMTDPDGYFRLGPIPQGTPVNLIANINPDLPPTQLLDLAVKINKAFIDIKAKGLDSEDAKELLRSDVAPALFAASKCPDLVTDRGHYYGNQLPDEDKKALIEYLKTL